MVKIFNEFFAGSAEVERLNYAFIVLKPKSEQSEQPSNFRPICLLNSVHKIIAKVLVNRLSPFKDKLVDIS